MSIRRQLISGRQGMRAAPLVLALALGACGQAVEAPQLLQLSGRPNTAASHEPEAMAAPTALPDPSPAQPERPIYVLNPNDQGTLSGIMVVDPDVPRIVSSIPTRFLPEAVLSPNGTRLYVADSYREGVTRGRQRDVVSVYDPHTGEVLVDDQPVQGRLLYKGLPVGAPFMFLSDDGSRLYLGKYGDPDLHQTRLAVLDAATLRTVHEGPYPPCGPLVIARSDGWICTPSDMGSGDFALVAVDPVEGVVRETLLAVPGLHLGDFTWTWDGERLLVLDSAELTIISITERRVIDTTRLEVPSGWTPAREMLVSPDGAGLYVGFDAGKEPSAVFSEVIAAFDPETGSRLSTIDLPTSATDLALSQDGKQLYAVSPFARSLAIYDTATGQEQAVMRDIEGTPARVLVPGPAE